MKARDVLNTLDSVLNEGLNDKYIFKAVFLAGGPGSGKSFIANNMFKGLGVKFLNSDTPLEQIAKKLNIDLKKSLFSPEVQKIHRPKAQQIAIRKTAISQENKLGIIVDGTGRTLSKIQKQVKTARDAGYDTSMIFVNTTVDVAIARDAKRTRTLGAEQVTELWNAVQRNIGAFQNLFGKENFILIDNSTTLDKQAITKLGVELRRSALQLLGSPIKNRLAKEWVIQQVTAITGKPNPKLANKILSNT